MVREFLKSEKNVFWEALIITIFIFLLGLLIGVFLENSRTKNLDSIYLESEFNLFDLNIQSRLFDLENLDCNYAVSENIKFGDKIFENALLLQKLEESEDLTDAIKVQHKKFDILRALFWINSKNIKERCGANYSIVVYLYDYNDVRLDTKAEQKVFSRVLSELKNKKEGKVMLIPIAGDNGLLSVNSLMEIHNVSEQELPIILIDEKYKINTLDDLENIEKYLS